MTKLKATALSVLAGLIITIDWVFKAYALERFPQTGSRNRFIDFILHKNPGIAFDIPISLWIIAPLTVIVCVWLLKISYKYWQSKKEISLSANIVVIGAVGNLVDRLVNGFTTDYILLLERIAINLSDILIISGILALLWYTKDTKTS